MPDKLLAEFPHVSYETWRSQVERDLKGADFDKRLLTRTLEGLVIQPLYTARDGGTHTPVPLRVRDDAANANWDVRAEQTLADPDAAAQEIAEDLSSGATSLWLRLDAQARTGDAARIEPDGLAIETVADLRRALAQVDLTRTAVAIDAGAQAAVSALVLAYAEAKAPAGALRGTLGFDPLGALARDGQLPYDWQTARGFLAQLSKHATEHYPQLRAAEVSTDSYHLAGANATQELAYAWATGLEYLRANLEAGLSVAQASAQIGFRVTVASDLFLEIAKLRALRSGWAKIVAAYAGDAQAQATQVHAVTSLRTKTRRDPWVNMLRATTEAFSALVAGADAATTRAFDVALGRSDGFARRIARNVQIILNEETYATRVADAAAGSYYVETLTDELGRSAWQLFQQLEAGGGLSQALTSGGIAEQIAQTAGKRAQALAKRSTPITGVSEFANLTEEPVVREAPAAAPRTAPSETATAEVKAALAQLEAARPEARVTAAIAAAASGVSVSQISAVLARGTTPAKIQPLPIHRDAEAFEALRDRTERHTAQSGQALSVFLSNLGEIPKHKARASYATGFFNAGGIQVLDNDGFKTVEDAVAAFAQSGTDTVAICGSDEQYLEWIPQLVPALRARGARHIVLAGRPGDKDKQADYERAGVNKFIFIGVDVVATLQTLLNDMGAAA